MVKTKAAKTTITKPRSAAKPVKKKAPVRKKGKPKEPKEMSAWCKYLLGVLVVVVFVSAFYFFFIRPYSYRWKPCYGLKGYGVRMPAGFKVHGIDVSHYQGTINWDMLKKTRQGNFPVEFIFMKATEGGDFSDDKFEANFNSAKSHGFIRGAYHFYNPKTDAIKQADFFIRSVKLEPGDLPPVLDIEKKGRDIPKLQNDLKIWLKRVEAHYGVKPIIYASYKFKTRYLNDAFFDSYPYWIAHYYVESVRYEGEWNFWQHTDVGTLPGIEEKVDLNVFNGSLSDMKGLLIPQKD